MAAFFLFSDDSSSCFVGPLVRGRHSLVCPTPVFSEDSSSRFVGPLVGGHHYLVCPTPEWIFLPPRGTFSSRWGVL